MIRDRARVNGGFGVTDLGFGVYGYDYGLMTW